MCYILCYIYCVLYVLNICVVDNVLTWCKCVVSYVVRSVFTVDVLCVVDAGSLWMCSSIKNTYVSMVITNGK